MTIDQFLQGPSVYIPIILFNLIITLLAYSSFPFIFSKVRKSPITKKKYRWLCFGVNLAVMFIFIIVNGKANGSPYFLWTTIFSNVGINTLSRRGLITNGEYLKDDSNRITECKSCGYQNKEYFDACPKCGKYAKQYIYLNKNYSADENQTKNASNFPDLDIDKMTPQEAAEYLVAEQIHKMQEQKAQEACKENVVRYCTNCGKLLVPNSKFCGHCGTQVYRKNQNN